MKEKRERLIDEARKNGIDGNIKEVKRNGRILRIKTGTEERILMDRKEELINGNVNLIIHWKSGKELVEKEKFTTKKWKKRKEIIIIDGKTGKELMLEKGKFLAKKY
jgi:ribulose bisphosphate carboxylase small subunit